MSRADWFTETRAAAQLRDGARGCGQPTWRCGYRATDGWCILLLAAQPGTGGVGRWRYRLVHRAARRACPGRGCLHPEGRRAHSLRLALFNVVGVEAQEAQLWQGVLNRADPREARRPFPSLRDPPGRPRGRERPLASVRARDVPKYVGICKDLDGGALEHQVRGRSRDKRGTTTLRGRPGPSRGRQHRSPLLRRQGR